MTTLFLAELPNNYVVGHPLGCPAGPPGGPAVADADGDIVLAAVAQGSDYNWEIVYTTDGSPEPAPAANYCILGYGNIGTLKDPSSLPPAGGQSHC